MKIYKPLQLSLLHKTFSFKDKNRLAIGLLLGFTFEENEALLEPDLWKFIASELGKGDILDIGMPKPNGEALVYGKCFAPKGKSVKTSTVRFKIGNIDKTLLVYGERYWRTVLGPSEPEPFTEMPISYANAFGGPGFSRNPIGKGVVDVSMFGEMLRVLPNIEYPDKVLTSLSERPDPAGFSPLGMTWEFRSSKLGTYDNKWLKERWPAYPDDLDWNHFNTAPSDQWLEQYFNGTEPFEVYNMHKDKPIMQGKLPGYRPRCFIERSSSEKGEIEEVNLRAETVWLFPHVETGLILYRGVINIETDDARDIQSLIAGYEHLSDLPRATSHYAAQLKDRQAGYYQLNTTELIPEGAICGFGALGDPKPESQTTSVGSGTNGIGDAADKSPVESKREALIALSNKLAEMPGTEATRAKIDDEIAATYLPPLFPRSLEHEQILNEYLVENSRKEELRQLILRQGGDAGTIQDIDIHETRARLEETGRELRENYRVQAHLLEEGRPAHEKHLIPLRADIIARLKNNESLAGWDLAGLDLSSQDLSGADLRYCYLEKVNFTESKLTGANLEGAILAFADLTRCNLSGANLKRANLGMVNLSDAILEDSDLSEAILARSILWGAQLTNCNLTDTDFMEADLADADMSGSIMPGAQFLDLHMVRTKFRNATLPGSTFTNCNLEHADFSNAIVEQSSWIESWLDNANFSGAQMSNSRFPGGSSLCGTKFTGAMLNSSNFRGSTLHNADFSEANIEQSDFGDCDARHAKFIRSIAKGSQFIGANLGEADLSFINLMEGSLMKARLTGAILQKGNCYGVEFMNATVGSTNFSGTLLNKTKLEQWRPS